jgi:hypothetical protein
VTALDSRSARSLCVSAAAALSRSRVATAASRNATPAATTNSTALARRDRRRRTMTPDGLLDAVPSAPPVRQHGQAVEIPPDVLGEQLRRAVAAAGLLAEGHRHDGVEIPTKLAAQSLRRGAARGGQVCRPAGPGSILAHDGVARPLGIALAGYLKGVTRRVRRDPMRRASREQLVQQQPEGVHVARGRQRVAANLLGARVRRCHQAKSRARDRLIHGGEARVQQLRDPEVEELHLARAGDEHVARLEVAVQNEILMRMVDGGAHLAKQSKPAGDVEPLSVAVLRDRQAIDVLEDEILGAAHPRRRHPGTGRCSGD